MREVSLGNGFYYWRLKTPRIEQAKEELWNRANVFWKGLVTESQFLLALDLYFQIVCEESEAEWRRTYGQLGLNLPKEIPLPVDCVTVPYRELDFITERLCNWLFLEGEPVWDVEPFHNRWSEMGEQDYSYIELPGISKDYVFTWGKYGRTVQMTLGQVMEVDPAYLLWADENTDKLSLSDSLRQEISDLIAQNELSRAERVNHENRGYNQNFNDF